jgi:hypothetical protein
MSLNFQVKLNPKWKQPDAAIRTEFRRAGQEAASALTRAYKSEIRAVGAVASAALIDSVSTKYQQRGSIQQFSMTAADHWINVEKGRRPNKPMPPVSIIASWMRLKGITGSAWAIAKSIAKKGIKGRFPLRHALRKARPAMRAAFDRAATRLAGHFRR